MNRILRRSRARCDQCRVNHAYASRMNLVVLLVAAHIALGQPAEQRTPPDRGPQDLLAPRRGPDRVNWWNDTVFYQIFPRSFADSTRGPLAGDGVGDLQGILEKLDYLNDGNPDTDTDLGIGGIWLTPFYPSPSYHGYDVTDYFEVHPQIGTVDDFKRLVGECHRRGIRVIVDLVLNHCSNRHEWFMKAADPTSPFHDWFIWADKDPGWRGPWNQRVWHRLPPAGPTVSERYYYGLFSPTMPDLNFRHRAVTDAMNEITRTWVSVYGADGVRLDAVRHLIEEGQVQQHTPSTHKWLADWHLNLKGANIDALAIGEVWDESDSVAAYVGSGMDLAFEFSLAEAMIMSVASGRAEAFIAAQQRVLALFPPNQYGRFLSNHDQTRVMTRLKGDVGAMKTAAALLLLGPGVPFIYYGEEIGMTGDKPDEKLRTPMQWTPEPAAGFTTGTPWARVNADVANVNVETQASEPGSLLRYYRRLMSLRNKYPGLASGRTWMVKADNPHIVAMYRHRITRMMSAGGPGSRSGEARPRTDHLLIVVNLGSEAVDQCTLAAEGSALRARSTGKDVLGHATMSELAADDTGSFDNVTVRNLAPRAAAVFELTPP